MVRVTRVTDLANFRMNAARMFPGIDAAELATVEATFGPGFVDVAAGEIVINFNAYAIDDGETVILVDPCIGDGKTRTAYAQWHQRTSDFLQRLEFAGYPPERIDIVVSTHLHADHVGWNTSWSGSAWVPTFPNATYCFVDAELDYWHGQHEATGPAAVAYGAYLDSVVPIVEAGVSRTVPMETVLAPGVRLVPAPGHTPGNVIIEVDDGGSGAVLTGDIIHHPLQLLRPDRSTNFCIDPDAARATRMRLLESFADSGALLFPAHFVAPAAGRVVRRGDAYGYEFS